MKLIRVTDESDGTLLNRGYSYHSQVVLEGDRALAFVAHADGPPRFFEVNIERGDVRRYGALVPDHPASTGEGWYFTADGEVCLTDGPQLLRVHPLTGETRVLMALSDPNRRLWQCHSDDSGTVHSGTVQRITNDGPYVNEGTLVKFGDESRYFPVERPDLDESDIDAAGEFVVIKEAKQPNSGPDNRIITLATGEQRWFDDWAGALGHSAMGNGYAIGEADKPEPGQCIKLDLRTTEWDSLFNTRNLGHVSVKAGVCVQADDSALWLVDMNGAGRFKLIDHGMIGNPADPHDYEFQCMANLSPCGRVVAYVSNVAGRFDLYILVL